MVTKLLYGKNIEIIRSNHISTQANVYFGTEASTAAAVVIKRYATEEDAKSFYKELKIFSLLEKSRC